MHKRLSSCLVLGIIFFAVAPTLLLAQREGKLIFSHKLHVVDQELECSTCHLSADRSQTGADNLFPSMADCANCHDVEDENTCSMCHSNPENPVSPSYIETYSQKFSHQRHVQAGLECQTCHEKVSRKTEVGEYILPTMVDCMTCHESRSISTTCNTCHLKSEKLLPASHTSNFIHSHSDLARMNVADISGDKNCNTCHKVDFCQQCHEGDNLERRTHPLNFEFTHSLFAQGKERECAACHTERSFCVDCHRDNNLMPQNHTVGWTNAIPGDGGRHKLEAANDLEACMACHEQDAQVICQPCHGN